MIVLVVMTCGIILVSCNDNTNTGSTTTTTTTTTATNTTTTPTMEYCKHDDPEKIIVVEAKNPTCQETGLTEGMKCLNCETMVVPQRILETISCFEGDWIVDLEPTKTEDGKRHTECTMCGELLTEQIIGAGSQGMIFYLNSDNTYTLNNIGTCTDTDIVIPRIYNGLPVTGIGYSVFENSNTLTSITIPDSIITIGKKAFYNCNSLKDVYYEGDVEGWLNITFDYYYANPIWYGANLYFNGELVTEIEIPDTVTSIGFIAFRNCTSLTRIVIPDSVTSFGDYAFYGCTSLESIIIPKSVTSIGMSIFYDCTSLTSIYFEGTVEEWNAMDGNKGNYWNYNVPATEVICSNGTISLN